VKNTEIAQIIGLLFSTVKAVHYFHKKWIGLHFGRLFHKRIWSPWTQFTRQSSEGLTASNRLFRMMQSKALLQSHLIWWKAFLAETNFAITHVPNMHAFHSQ
jgi:hypothetical protein